MAEVNSTLESPSPQDNFSYTRRLTVKKSIFVEPPVVDGATECPPVMSIDPCIVLRGKWLKAMGFGVGQNATVHLESGILHITADLPGEWDFDG